MNSPGSSGRHVREAALGNAGDLVRRGVMAEMAWYKGNRNPSQAGEKSEGREVPKRAGNTGGGKAPYFHRVP